MPYFGASPSSELANLDINGQKLILDADADTSITSDTDDQIDVEISGADDFRFTANTLTALSGSTIAANTIAETTAGSGVTIDGLLIKDTTAAFADGAVTTPSITNTGDLNTGVYFPAADTVGVTAGGTEQFRFGSNPIPGGSKNLVLNGGMTVAQRAATSISASAYGAVDQWPIHLASSAGRFDLSQDSTLGSAVPLGHGFSLKIDCTTAEGSLASGDVITLRHHIEAQNLQHLRYGAATAKTVTLSFWMSSPKSGTHCVALNQPDSSERHYISEFTVASADTWEHFKITIPGDTSGTINNDTGAGLDINFPLVCGSTYQNTKDAWAAGADYGTSSVQNLLDNTSNNIYITGVQLEVGSVATDFAHEDYGTTLNKCFRYYERITYDSTDSEMVTVSYVYDANTNQGIVYYMEKRATPTVTLTAGATFKGRSGGSGFTAGTGNAAANIGHRSCLFQLTTSGSPWTAGHGGDIRRDGTDTTYIEVSSEL